MTDRPNRTGGSRFLYEPFDATSARLDAAERLNQERWLNLERRLRIIEGSLERMERRMWVAVTGIATFLTLNAATTLFTQIQ